MGIVLDLHGISIYYKPSNLIPAGKVFVFTRNNKFYVRSKEQLTPLQILDAVSQWHTEKIEHELKRNAKTPS